MKKRILAWAFALLVVFAYQTPVKALESVDHDEKYEDTIDWGDLTGNTVKINISIPKTTMELKVGGTGSFAVHLSRADGEPVEIVPVWASWNTKVATVNQNGAVKAVGVGKTVIEVKVQKSVFKCFVTVKAATPKAVKISKSTYTYNGKVQKPSVTVTGVDGKKLPSSQYTVKYSAGCKNVGTYQVTVTMKGNYKGTYKFAYKIQPKGTSITKKKGVKKAFTLTWKRQSSQVDGYQIRYSLKKNMTGAKVVTVKKNKTTSYTAKKLKGRKTYYVQVRTYKKTGGKNYYSSWSGMTSVKTKK